VSVSLVPSFSWSVHDYYVRCAAGTNALIVSMIASPGAESALLQPKISTSEPEQILALRVDENQAIVATATRGTASTEYWVRCLPHDFPHLQMSPHADAGIEPRPGYYLVGNRQTLNGAGAYAMVLNASGVPVWYFHETRGPGVLNVDSVTKGAVSFVAPGLHGAVFPYEIHQLSPWKTAYTDAPGTVFDEHELRALPNGDYLILSDPGRGRSHRAPSPGSGRGSRHLRRELEHSELQYSGGRFQGRRGVEVDRLRTSRRVEGDDLPGPLAREGARRRPRR
jgi:hypothetical protein